MKTKTKVVVVGGGVVGASMLYHLAKKGKNLVTIGIKPNHPSTAYGYIQYDEKSEQDHIDAYHVKTFAEKPHKKLAERFVASGDFMWNAGMFFWKVGSN